MNSYGDMSKYYFYIFHNDQLLVTTDTALVSTIQPYIIRHLQDQHDPKHPFNIIELASNLPIELNGTYPLRLALTHIEQQCLFPAIKAHSILRWDKLNQYCGACGNTTVHRPPHYERVCQHCNTSYFPRISPCIIVRVHRENELLMTRSHHFPSGVYGLVAGFIEPGESAEQAVARELAEETGICAKNLKYFTSQPWPFPDALMLGFTAEYLSGELKIDHQELETAGWFHYNKLPGRPSNPRSIASNLIDDFIEKTHPY